MFKSNGEAAPNVGTCCFVPETCVHTGAWQEVGNDDCLCDDPCQCSQLVFYVDFACDLQVATAYGILSDAAKRHKYDVGGYDSLEQSDLHVEVDPASLNFVTKGLAAVFSKMGNFPQAHPASKI